MSINTDTKELASAVSSLQSEVSQIGALVERLDLTIEKLTEVSTTVSQLLAVQGNRLDFQEKIQEKLQDLVEKRRLETETSIKEIYARIEKVERGFHQDMGAMEGRIITQIDSLQSSGTAQHKQINIDLDSRINRIEKWMWTIIGGGAVITFFLNNAENLKILAN